MSTLPLAQLEPSDSQELIGKQMLGFTLKSWLNCYESLGPVFRIQLGGLEHTVICGHQADREAWRQADSWNYTDTDSGTFFRNEMGEDHVTQLTGESHRRSRKLILPAFGIKALQRDFPGILTGLQSAFTNQLTPGETYDLFSIANFAYTKALANSQLKSNLDDVALDRLAQFEDWFISGLRVPPEQQAQFHQSDEYLKRKQEAFAIFERVVADRKAGLRPGDSLDLLIEQPSQENLAPLSDTELAKAVYLLSVAGVGNIANILVAAVWLLHEHPAWLKKLQHELDESDLNNMVHGVGKFPVMKAVMAEVERYYQPAPVIQKITTEDVDILGQTIPKNQSVLHMHGLSHYDSDYYSDPLTFDPGRWLDGSPEKPHVFGGGKHLCLGMGVARVLAPLSLGILLQEHNIEPVEVPQSVVLAPEIETSPTTTEFKIRVVQ